MSITGSISTTTDLGDLDVLITRLERVELIVAKYGALVLAEAQRLVHVDTGALKASIHLVLTGMTAEIIAGEGLTYAAALEYGTARATAYPYMRPAMERYAAAFLREIAAVFSGG